MKNRVILLFAVIVLSSFSAKAFIDFSPNHVIVSCGPNTVYFVYNQAVTPDQIFWDFGDGTTSNQIAPSHYYDSIGKFTVKMVIIKNNIRDSVVKENFVTIHPAAEAQMLIYKRPDATLADLTFESHSKHNADSFVMQRWIIETDTIYDDTFNYLFMTDGNYHITLTVQNNAGCSSETTSVIKIADNGFEPVTGLREFDVVKIPGYPNPANERISFNLPLGKVNGITRLYDLTGKEHILQPVPTNSTTLTLDTSVLPPGSYFLLYSGGTHTWRSHFQVVR